MTTFVKRLLGYLVVAAIAGFLFLVYGPYSPPGIFGLPGLVNGARAKLGVGAAAAAPKGRFAATGPVQVLAADATYVDAPVTLDAVGSAAALATVTVRSQVDGKLAEVDFKEGQDVAKGDTLARIDPAPFQATLDQARAKLAQDQAQLANAQLDLIRYEKLAATNFGSKQQADTQRATVAQLVALTQADRAQIDAAQVTLNYATIKAPIAGRTGLRLVDPGNVVHASDATGIVTITQVRPISVVFNAPQQRLPEIAAAMAAGDVPVAALGVDGTTTVDSGRLTTIDNAVDPTTGTVKMRAEFPNAGLKLWPGQYVEVRVVVRTLKHVVSVPVSAVQRGPDGAFVYAVAGDAAKLTPVTVVQQDDMTAVIGTGLTPPVKVVTTGFAQLTDGAKIALPGPPAADAGSGAGKPAAGGGKAGGAKRGKARDAAAVAQ